jgi:hypothetical protein
MLWELDMVLLNLLELAGIPANLLSQDGLGASLTHNSVLRRAFLSVQNLCLSFPASCESDNIVFSPLHSTSSQKMRDFFDRYGYSAESEWLSTVDNMISIVGTSWDVQCRFGESGNVKISRIEGSLQA